MGNLIVSSAISGQSVEFAKITFPLIKAYADKCGADFKAVMERNPKYSHPAYQKWDYVRFLDEYDRILHIDADMVVRSNTPDLFKLVPSNKFAAVDELPFESPDKESPYVSRIKDRHLPARHQDLDFYVNCGMYLFSKEHSWLFHNDIVLAENFHFKEQTVLNINLICAINKPMLLPWNYNYMSLMENHGLPKDEAYIVHYAGNYRGYSTEQVIEMMKKDIR